MYHDIIEGNVYVSQDEGKSWERAEGIQEGKALMFFEHPFDNKIVRISYLHFAFAVFAFLPRLCLLPLVTTSSSPSFPYLPSTSSPN